MNENGKKKNIEQKYLYYLLSTIDISRYITGAVQPKINQENGRKRMLFRNMEVRLGRNSLHLKEVGKNEEK